MSFEEKLVLDRKVQAVIGWIHIVILLVLFLVLLSTRWSFPMSAPRQSRVMATSSADRADTQEMMILNNTEQLAGLQSQVSGMQRQLDNIDKMNLESRLTRLEAYSESNRTILIGIALAVGTMLLEAGHRLLKPRREDDSDGGRRYATEEE